MRNCTVTIVPAHRPDRAGEIIAMGLRLLAKGVGLAVVALMDAMVDRLDRRRHRRLLLEADDRILKDVGLSRADAYRLTGRRERAKWEFDGR